MQKWAVMVVVLSTLWCQNLWSQQTEVNLKWGKPTDEELKMDTYAPDKDANAVVL